MKVIVDGDSVFVAADDFVNLQESDVSWIDVPVRTLGDFIRRDRNHSLREAARRVDALLSEAERICLEHDDDLATFCECQMVIHEARGVLGMS